jgi:NAD(P)-dependent dehydrogenase (short-subunit alcohol dehydrogenase family)
MAHKNMPTNPPLFDLGGKIAVVSGAAGGMGKAASQALAAHGATVIMLDRNEAGLAATGREIAAAGGRAVGRLHDTSSVDAARRLFEWIDAEHGRVDFLANVAGESIMVDPLKITPEQIRQVLENLVVGRFAHCREAALRMFRQGGGSIVNIGSIGGMTSLGRGHIAYAMAMGAVAQMTRELSTEWAARGVRVNAILPAQVMNAGIEQRIAADPAIEKKWLSGIPRGRLGRPEDIQGLMVLLASDASSWITGTLIPMDGGNLAMNAGGTIGPRDTGDDS